MREVDGNSHSSGNDVDAALDRIEAAFLQQSQRIATGTKRSLVAMAVTIASDAPFVAGMPFHRLFVPWGQVLLVVCALTIAVTVWHMALFIGDYFDRKRMDKQRRFW
jgi:hypothetical protein